MLNELCGYGAEETVAALERAIGKRIRRAKLNDRSVGKDSLPDCSATELIIEFPAGKLIVSDEGQSCCETRFMTTDDDLQYFKGAVLQGLELRDGPGQIVDDDETCFLDVKTDKGVFTVVNHNDHNGYYGGFSIRARWEQRNKLARDLDV